MPRALLSVTDKTGVVDFARALSSAGWELLSTGGTAKALRDAGLQVRDVSDVTGFPEMLDGRVKTLHPMVHGGLLGDRRLESHRTQMEAAGIVGIDLLCVNLYRFEETVSKPHEFEGAIESIDIGGPAMIRAAAKNHANVAVVTNPDDYQRVLDNLADLTGLRRELAAKAFRHTAYYDSVIARYLSGPELGETLTLGLRRRQAFRYGENPHQQAGWYVDPLAKGGVAQGEVLWGKEVSYNNLADADAAYELVADLPAGSCAIIKHGNPCGASTGADLGAAYRSARQSDPISAFGGIAAFNQPVDQIAAEAMTEKGNFLEVVVAPSFTEEALEILKSRSGWGQDVRLVAAPLSPSEAYLSVRTLRGGAIVQDSDEDPGNEWRIVTAKVPSESEMAALRLQWAILPHVKSNAIVVGDSVRMLGVGAGQMNRVQSVRLALEQAGELSRGAVLASDAFFPFPDSVETAAAAGIAAIVQPGGSKKDGDVISRANELGLSMVFTGTRRFRH